MSSSIMQALYNSVSGLFGFSQSLNTISDNISNMNTPGFRGEESFFENVMDGDGTRVAGTGRDLSEGQIQQESTTTDVAIQGQGLFILKDSQGNLYYTRSGQFELNSDGKLVDSVNKYFVQGYDANGNFGSIDVGDLKSLPAQATATVDITGNISGTTSTSVSNITVYDDRGTAHVLSVSMAPDTTVANAWTATVTDSNGNTLGSGDIHFSTTGVPMAGFTQVSVTATLGSSPQTLVFDFGVPNGVSGATAISGEPTSLAAKVLDGHGVIGLTSQSFDSKGVLQLTYADGETKAGPQLALATFPNESALQAVHGNLYLPPQDQAVTVSRAASGALGQIDGSSLEMSNVDLTRELADMIVIQRGYQASSRVMTVSSDMLQQLYQSTQGN
ncbi:flagellar hook-basal body complex protein [Dyella sp.]|uniref:flagellar hook-basal body complex protein n=1 Tax=Dyella sp. TaxID=1869338 RepID=UPI002ED56DD8